MLIYTVSIHLIGKCLVHSLDSSVLQQFEITQSPKSGSHCDLFVGHPWMYCTGTWLFNVLVAK